MWKPKIHAPGPNATAAGPSIQWRPKKPLEQEVNSENALEIISQSPRGTQEANPTHSQSSYIPSLAKIQNEVDMQNAQNGQVLQNQPNLDLLMDQQMMEAQNHSSSSSSEDSGVVTSARTAAVIIPPFILKVCQKLPLDSVIPVWKEDIQKALVPARPVMDCILIELWEALFGDKTQTGVVPRPISIPTLVSKRPGSRTPLVDTMVRRSPRINPSAVNGF